MRYYFYINKLIIALIVIGLSFAFAFAFAEELVITTYYPSPYGSYNELTAYKIKIGDSYTGSSIDTDNLVVEGRIGIGTNTPNAQLQVKGSGSTDWISLDAVNGGISVNISSGEALYVNAGGSGFGQYFSGNDFGTGTLTLGYQVSPSITTEVGRDLTIDAGGTGRTIIQDDLGVKKYPTCTFDVNGTICGSSSISASTLSVNSISAGSISASGDITTSASAQAGQDIIAGDELCIGGDCRRSWPIGSCPINHTGHTVVTYDCVWSSMKGNTTKYQCPTEGQVLAGRDGTGGRSVNQKYKCCSLRIVSSL